MRAILIIAATLVVIPAQAASLKCMFLPKLWPTECQPPGEIVPVPAPRPAEAPPAPARLDAPSPLAHAPPTRPKPLPRIIRPKYKPAPAKARRRAASAPSWCSRVPAGTTLAQIEGAASGFGKTLTPAQRQQARACLASKIGTP